MVQFNGAATQSSIQSLLQSLGFKFTDKVNGNRSIRMQITNVSGGNTNPTARQIQVSR